MLIYINAAIRTCIIQAAGITASIVIVSKLFIKPGIIPLYLKLLYGEVVDA